MLLKGYNINRAKKELESLDLLRTTLGIDSYREQQFKDIVNYHLLNTPWYSEFCRSANIVNLPVIKKKDLQVDFSKLLSTPYKKRKIYVASTSGSSGNPFKFAKDKFCHSLTWASVNSHYGQYGISLNSSQARFYGIPLNRSSLYSEMFKDLIMNRHRFPVFDLSDESFYEFLKVFRRKKFDYLYGYTSALVQFARFLVTNKINLKVLNPTLKICIYTSETSTKEDIDIMRTAFGIPIICEYGASETGIIAFENSQGLLEVDDNLILLEEHFDTDSNAKTTLVTALFNYAFPLIRYDIGDISELNINGNHSFIRELIGRTNDIIQLPSGKKAAGLTFYYISRSILEKSGCLKEFIIIQKEINVFNMEIVSSRELTLEEVQLIKNESIRYLESGLEINIIYKESLPRLKNGKIKHFISEI